VRFHYGAKDPETAHIDVVYGGPDMMAKAVSGTADTMKQTRQQFAEIAKSNPDMAKMVKDWDEKNRVVTLGKAETSVVMWHDGVAEAEGVMPGRDNLFFQMLFPATSLDDAESKARTLYAAIHFDMIGTSAIAPLGVVEAKN
jgi:hypothetical protein